MATINISKGGDRPNNYPALSQFPSRIAAATEGELGYAEHQQSCDYDVIRHIDTRPYSPVGDSGTSTDLADFLACLEVPVAVGDVLATHTLKPGSVLQAVHYTNLRAVPGFTFDLVTITTPPLPAAPVTTTILGGVVGTALTTTPQGYNIPTIIAFPGLGTQVLNPTVVGIRVTALPTAGFEAACSTGGLFMKIGTKVWDPRGDNA